MGRRSRHKRLEREARNLQVVQEALKNHPGVGIVEIRSATLPAEAGTGKRGIQIE